MYDPIRLYLDEDALSRALIRALRSRSTDVLTAREAGLIQIPDEHHLEYVTSLNRTVFTFNVRGFARLHAERDRSLITARSWILAFFCCLPVAGQVANLCLLARSVFPQRLQRRQTCQRMG